MKKLTPIKLDILISFVAALVISLALAALQPPPFFSAWYGANLLLWLSFFLGLRVWRYFSGGRLLAILMLLTFFLRLVLGLFLYTSLPEIGYNSDSENAGYAYSDAYTRDTFALTLARSDTPLVSVFTDDQGVDQYGGLLFLSSAVYRYFSLDEPRPLLITILGALVMTVGLAFLYDAVRRRWGEKVALVAGWFFALYPEGILLGSSQMREPFLIGFFCIAFWAVVTWREKTAQKLLFYLIPTLLSLAFSLPFGAIIAAFILAFGFVEWLVTQKKGTTRTIGFAVLAVAGVVALIAGWMWIKPTIYYDAFITRVSSGNMTVLLDRLDPKLAIPFITFYGFTQPFLPGALTDAAQPVWKTIAIVRSLGWWFVLPFMLYGFFAVWKAPRSQRWGLVLIALTLAAWILISSLRAGGDLWDNPRYRALLIPWFAVIVGWCWQHIRDGHLAWFLRWLGVLLIFFMVFFLWYMFRYQVIKNYIGFFDMIRVIAAGSVLIIVSGLGWDLYQWLKRRRKTQSAGLE